MIQLYRMYLNTFSIFTSNGSYSPVPIVKIQLVAVKCNIRKIINDKCVFVEKDRKALFNQRPLCFSVN